MYSYVWCCIFQNMLFLYFHLFKIRKYSSIHEDVILLTVTVRPLTLMRRLLPSTWLLSACIGLKAPAVCLWTLPLRDINIFQLLTLLCERAASNNMKESFERTFLEILKHLAITYNFSFYVTLLNWKHQLSF